ncbi:hypothetical protein Tco_0716681 [Tanacetum coccineum]
MGALGKLFKLPKEDYDIGSVTNGSATNWKEVSAVKVEFRGQLSTLFKLSDPCHQSWLPDHISSGPVLHEMILITTSSYLLFLASTTTRDVPVENVSCRPRSSKTKASDYDNSDPSAQQDKMLCSYTEKTRFGHNRVGISSVLT